MDKNSQTIKLASKKAKEQNNSVDIKSDHDSSEYELDEKNIYINWHVLIEFFV